MIFDFRVPGSGSKDVLAVPPAAPWLLPGAGLGEVLSLLPKELLCALGSLFKPVMGRVELIPLAAQGMPCCRIIFPVSVNHLTAAVRDSYASDLLISQFIFFFIYDIANHSVAVHRSEVVCSHGILEYIEYLIAMRVYIYLYTKWKQYKAECFRLGLGKHNIYTE